jgi:hypothetical protein
VEGRIALGDYILTFDDALPRALLLAKGDNFSPGYLRINQHGESTLASVGVGYNG